MRKVYRQQWGKFFWSIEYDKGYECFRANVWFKTKLIASYISANKKELDKAVNTFIRFFIVNKTTGKVYRA